LVTIERPQADDDDDENDDRKSDGSKVGTDVSERWTGNERIIRF
jgi:hypothetical protein